MIGCLRVLKIAAQNLDQSEFVRVTTLLMNKERYAGIIGMIMKAMKIAMMYPIAGAVLFMSKSRIEGCDRSVEMGREKKERQIAVAEEDLGLSVR